MSSFPIDLATEIQLGSMGSYLRWNLKSSIRVVSLPRHAGNYGDDVIGVIYAIFITHKHDQLLESCDNGRSCCFMVTTKGNFFELGGSLSDFWPIIVPKNHIKTADLKRHLPDIKHFLLTGKILTPRLYEKKVGANNSRLHRVIRAEEKGRELVATFPSLKIGPANEG